MSLDALTLPKAMLKLAVTRPTPDELIAPATPFAGNSQLNSVLSALVTRLELGIPLTHDVRELGVLVNGWLDFLPVRPILRGSLKRWLEADCPFRLGRVDCADIQDDFSRVAELAFAIGAYDALSTTQSDSGRK